jgi:hypothetical protein
MKTNPDIEATLERSLRKQIAVPRLNHKFDAAVWARIEAQESRAPAAFVRAPATAPKWARWLGFMNVMGLASVAIFLLLFGTQMLADMQGEVSLPQISMVSDESGFSTVSGVIALASLLFGFAYTPWGRRLMNEFR